MLFQFLVCRFLVLVCFVADFKSFTLLVPNAEKVGMLGSLSMFLVVLLM